MTAECPVCGLEGTLQEVRAHVTVQAQIDDDHAIWCADRGIDFADDTQSSVSDLTYALSREEE